MGLQLNDWSSHIDPWKVTFEGAMAGILTRIIGKLLANEHVFTIIRLPSHVSFLKHFVLGAVPVMIMGLASEILNAEPLASADAKVNLLKKCIIFFSHASTSYALCQAIGYPILQGMGLAAGAAGVIKFFQYSLGQDRIQTENDDANKTLASPSSRGYSLDKNDKRKECDVQSPQSQRAPVSPAQRYSGQIMGQMPFHPNFNNPVPFPRDPAYGLAGVGLGAVGAYHVGKWLLCE